MAYSYDPVTKWYEVKYKDGEIDDLTHEEVTKFLDQATNDITVTKFLDIDYPMHKQLEQIEDDIAITKYLASTNDTTVTKFLD